MESPDGHRYYEGLAVAHVLGGLDDTKNRVFRAHLLECVDCRARVGELRAIAHELADVERDERRMRAAQVIDTKRRESEEEEEELQEAPQQPRSARITAIVGIVLVVGLSLWNFALRGELTTARTMNRNLVDAAVIAETGMAWRTSQSAAGLQGGVKQRDDQFVITLEGLDPEQVYGLYVLNAAGKTINRGVVLRPDKGHLHQLVGLHDSGQRVLLTDPPDDGERIGQPGADPTGDTVFEARRP